MSRTRAVLDEWQSLLARYPHLARRDWTLRISDRMTSTLGRCRFREREVVLARFHVENYPLEEVIDTVRHEVAHALLGPGHGHGTTWQDKAVEVGADPTRCSDNVDDYQRYAPAAKQGPKWAIRCANCGRVVARRKSLRGRFRDAVLHGAPGYSSRCCRAPLEGERLR